jgi:hypothetical protein
MEGSVGPKEAQHGGQRRVAVAGGASPGRRHKGR